MVIALVVIVAAVVLAGLYFFMTKAEKMPRDGSWLASYKYAHRGLHNEEFPENSLPAFGNAVEKGYAIELDVHLSSDGELIVYHDNTLERMTEHSGKVEDYTAEQLAGMKLAGSEYTIPTLGQVFDKVGGKVPILIETKNEGVAGALEVKLYEALRNYKGLFAVQSFSPFSIGWFKKNAPDVIRGQLAADFREGAESVAGIKKFVIRNLLTNFLCRPQFISYCKEGIGRGVVRRLRKKGTSALAWTVRSREEADEAAPYADSIIFENYEP